MTQPDLAWLLMQAQEAEVGISVITDNPQLLKNKLYAERKLLHMNNLTFVQPPVDSDTRLWIIKKEAKPDGTNQD